MPKENISITTGSHINDEQAGKLNILYINTVTGQSVYTENASADVIIVGTGEGVADDGRLFGAFSSIEKFPDGYKYTIFMGGENVTLTVGGNSNMNQNEGQKTLDLNWLSWDRSQENFGPSDYRTALPYNIYHLAWNPQEESNPADAANFIYGAVKFNSGTGTANLVLTAQNGTMKANSYGNNGLKTDDNIVIQSDHFSIWGMYDSSSAGDYRFCDEPFAYGYNSTEREKDFQDAPASNARNYTIQAADSLNVRSDLVGKINANIAVMHIGYGVGFDDNLSDTYNEPRKGQMVPVQPSEENMSRTALGHQEYKDDASGNLVDAVGVSVGGTLSLENNFRAVITVRNNEDTWDDAVAHIANYNNSYTIGVYFPQGNQTTITADSSFKDNENHREALWTTETQKLNGNAEKFIAPETKAATIAVTANDPIYGLDGNGIAVQLENITERTRYLRANMNGGIEEVDHWGILTGEFVAKNRIPGDGDGLNANNNQLDNDDMKYYLGLCDQDQDGNYDRDVRIYVQQQQDGHLIYDANGDPQLVTIKIVSAGVGEGAAGGEGGEGAAGGSQAAETKVVYLTYDMLTGNFPPAGFTFAEPTENDPTDYESLYTTYFNNFNTNTYYAGIVAIGENDVDDTAAPTLVEVMEQSDRYIPHEYGREPLDGSTFAAFAENSVKDNNVTLSGIEAANIEAENGIWAGNITVDNSNNHFLADKDYLIGPGDAIPNTETGEVSGNTVSATAIEATGTVSIAKMGALLVDYDGRNNVDNPAPAQINATVSGNVFRADTHGLGERNTSTSVTSNTLSATAVSAGTLNLGIVESGVEFNATVTGNSFQAEHCTEDIVKTDDTTRPTAQVDVSGNKIEAYGIRANSANLDFFAGDINVTVENQLDTDERIVDFNEVLKSIGEDRNQKLQNTVYGILVERDLISTGYIGGSITISSFTTQVDLWRLLLTAKGYGDNAENVLSLMARQLDMSLDELEGWINTSLSDISTIAGISASSITVNGVISSDINITQGGYGDNDIRNFGIYARNTLTASSITGDINNSGEYLHLEGNSPTKYNASNIAVRADSLTTGNANDALDITGDIVSNNGISAMMELNLRIAGSITADASAIDAEFRPDFSKDNDYINKIGQNDRIELAAGSYVTGDINLRMGTNRVNIHSDARLDGVITSQNGQTLFTFTLDETGNADYAYNITKQSPYDQLVYGASNININMCYAAAPEEGGDPVRYHLISYANDVYNAYVFAQWTGRQINILYQNGSGLINLQQDENRLHGEVDIRKPDGTVIARVSATFTDEGAFYVEIISKTEQVAALPENENDNNKLSVSNESLVAMNYGTMTIDWSDFAEDNPNQTYSVTYTVYNADGVQQAQPMTITTNGTNCAVEIFDNRNRPIAIERDWYVEWNVSCDTDDGDTVSSGVSRNCSREVTFDWSELNDTLSRIVGSDLEMYTDRMDIAEITSYKLEYRVAGGWNTVNFYELDDRFSHTVTVAGEIEEWRVTPLEVVTTDGALVNNKEIRNLLVTEFNNGSFELSWGEDDNHHEDGIVTSLSEYLATSHGMNMAAEDYYCITYTVYDLAGTVVGSADQRKYVSGTESGTTVSAADLGVNALPAGYRIVWSIEAFDVTANNSSYGNDTPVDSVINSYNSADGVATIDWSVLADEINANLSDYDFSSVHAWEIEYRISDENGNSLSGSNGDGDERTIVARVNGNESSLNINGILEGYSIEWRIRAIGNNTDSLVTNWSSYQTFDCELNDTKLDISGIETSVADPYSAASTNSDPNAATNITGALATLRWGYSEGEEPQHDIRCYDIEYCYLKRQVTMEDAERAGAASIEDYVANYLFAHLNDFAVEENGAVVYQPETFTKRVTGNSVTINTLPDGTYVYWRIRAIDSEISLRNPNPNDNGVSQWQSGEHFSVFRADSGCPDISNINLTAFTRSLNPASMSSATDIEGYIAWNSATDSGGSGVHRYEISLSNSGNETVFNGTRLAVDNASPLCIGEYILNDQPLSNVDAGFEVGYYLDGGEGAFVTDGFMVNVHIDYNSLFEEVLILEFAYEGDLTGRTLVFRDANGDELNATGSYTKYDYFINIDDVDINGNPEMEYNININVVDNFGNSTSGSGDFVVDSGNIQFVETDAAANIGYYVDSTNPATINEPSYLEGFVCWNKAIAKDGGIRAYTLSLVDADGNVILDSNGDACSERIDLSDDPLSLDPVPRSIVTYTDVTLQVDGVYTVTYEENGETITLDAVCKNVNGVATLFITGEGDLRDKTLSINGSTQVTVDNNNCRYYEYSVDLSQWQLPSQLGNIKDNYTVRLEAVDYHNNSISQTTGLVVDNSAPEFLGGSGYVVSVAQLASIGATPVVSGKIAWNKAVDDDSEIAYYTVTITNSNGETIATVDIDKTANANTQDSALVITELRGDFIVGETYNIEGIGAVLTKQDDNGAYLRFAANAVLDTYTVNGFAGEVTVSCTRYEYSIDLPEGLTDQNYSYQITATDRLGKQTNIDQDSLPLVIDQGDGPEIDLDSEGDTTGYFVNYNNLENIDAAASIFGYVVWDKAQDKDTPVSHYTVTLSYTDAEPVSITIDFTQDHGDNLDGDALTSRSIVAWVGEGLSVDGVYTVTYEENGETITLDAVCKNVNGVATLFITGEGDLRDKTLSINRSTQVTVDNNNCRYYDYSIGLDQFGTTIPLQDSYNVAIRGFDSLGNEGIEYEYTVNVDSENPVLNDSTDAVFKAQMPTGFSSTDASEHNGIIAWDRATDDDSKIRGYKINIYEVVEVTTTDEKGNTTTTYVPGAIFRRIVVDHETVEGQLNDIYIYKDSTAKSIARLDASDSVALKVGENYTVTVVKNTNVVGTYQVVAQQDSNGIYLEWYSNNCEDLSLEGLIAEITYFDTKSNKQILVSNVSFNATHYDYAIDIENLGLTGERYNYEIVAIDYNGKESETITKGEIVEDNVVPSFTRIENQSQIGIYSEYAKPENLTADAVWTGYIGWNKAVDSHTGVSNYVVTLTDSNGDVVGTKTIDFTTGTTANNGDVIDGDNVCARSIVTLTEDDLGIELMLDAEGAIGNRYSVSCNGAELDAVVKKVGNDVSLIITGAGDLRNEEIVISGGNISNSITCAVGANVKCEYYDYAIDIREVFGDLTDEMYHVAITAGDYYEHACEINKTINGDYSRPNFDVEHDFVFKSAAPGSLGENAMLDQYSVIAWNKATDDDSEIRSYMVKITDNDKQDGHTVVKNVYLDMTEGLEGSDIRDTIVYSGTWTSDLLKPENENETVYCKVVIEGYSDSIVVQVEKVVNAYQIKLETIGYDFVGKEITLYYVNEDGVTAAKPFATIFAGTDFNYTVEETKVISGAAGTSISKLYAGQLTVGEQYTVVILDSNGQETTETYMVTAQYDSAKGYAMPYLEWSCAGDISGKSVKIDGLNEVYRPGRETNRDEYICKYYDYALDLEQLRLDGNEYYYEIIAIDYNNNKSSISGNGRIERNEQPIFRDANSDGISVAHSINYQWKAAADNVAAHAELTGYIGWEKADDNESGIRSYVLTLKDTEGNVVREAIIAIDADGNNSQNYVGKYANNNFVNGEVYTVKFGNGQICTAVAKNGSIEWSSASDFSGNCTITGAGFASAGLNVAETAYSKSSWTKAEPVGIAKYRSSELIVGETYTISYAEDASKSITVIARKDDKGVYLSWDFDVSVKNYTLAVLDQSGENVNSDSSLELNIFDYGFDLSQWNLTGTGYSYEITVRDYNGENSTTITGTITADDANGAYFRYSKEIELGSFVTSTRPENLDAYSLMQGYICWNMAVDDYAPIQKYVVEVIGAADADGNPLKYTYDLGTYRSEDPALNANPAKNKRFVGSVETSLDVTTADQQFCLINADGSDVIGEVKTEIIARRTDADGDTEYRLVLHYTGEGTLPENAKIQQFINGTWTNFYEQALPATTFDYCISIDDWQQYLNEGQYEFKVTAYDYYGDIAGTTSALVQDMTSEVSRVPLFQDINGLNNGNFGSYVTIDSKKYVDDIVQNPTLVKPTLTGFIGWDKALDPENGVLKYEVTLFDAAGEIVHIELVDFSGNGSAANAPGMSVLTHYGTYEVGEEYSVSWDGGTATVVAQSNSVGAYLRWSAEGTLANTEFFVGDNMLTDVSAVYYDYSVNIDDWNLTGQQYKYQIKAYDFHGNASESKQYYLIADSNKAPSFADTDTTTLDFGFEQNQILAPSGQGNGFVRGNKDSINTNGYETYLNGNIFWDKAEDSEIGVRYYELVLNSVDGRVTYYIDADGVGYKNTVSFNSIPYSEDIDLENLSITVYINGVEIPGYQLSPTISEGWINFEDLVIYSKEELHLGEDSINIVLNLNEDSGFSGNPAALIGFSSVECNLVRIENGRYILDTELLPDRLTRSDYTYEIYAVDKLGNKSEMLESAVEGSSGVIDIDRANPVFGSRPADLITEAIAFTNVENGQYSATIGWSGATDDVGIHAYRITLTDANGNTIEKRVLKERTESNLTSDLRTSGTDYSVAVWRSEDLIIGETYTVTDANGNSLDVIAQERRETINYNLEDGTVQDGVRAQEVVGIRFISWSGEGFNGGNVTITGPNGYSQTISGSPVDTNETYQYANYNNSFTIEGLASGEYSYTIKAEDYFGNLSAPVTGNLVFDNIAPEFFGTTNNVSWVNNANDTFTPTFTWSKAIDGNGGVGVDRYEIRYRVNGEWVLLATKLPSENDGDTVTWTASEAIANGTYEYRIIALDKVGNASTLSGSFGSRRNDYLTGSFSDCRVEMSAEGEDKDINGNFIDPHVTLRWRYSDPGQVERFRVTVNVGSKSYTFWTDDAYQTFMEFDQTTIGRPVDIFSSNETITWTVDAFDSNKNASFVTSGTQSISSIKQSADGAPAPVDLEVIYGNQVAGDRVNTDIVGVTWNTANADLGVYYYELTLERLDENGNVAETFTKSTLTTSIPGNANDYLEADINPDLVDIRNYGGNYTSVTIADLRKFFGIANFRDGDYKISVKSFDAQGNSKADAYASTGLIFDTARPGLVNVDMVTAKAFAYNISDEARRQELVIEWEGISDASGIDYYEVQYRPAGSNGSWVTAIVKHVDGQRQFCVAEVSGETNVRSVEYRITAYDKLGNRGLVWDSYQTIEMVEDKYADTEYTGRVYTERQFGISDSVGRGDAADCFQFTTTSEETVNFNVTELVGTGLSGNIDGIVIEVYKKTASGFTFVEELEFGVGSNAGSVVLEAGTTYSFKIKNADPAGKSSSQYTINVDRASQVIVPGENPGDPDMVVPTDDQPWFNLENFSASVVDTDLSSEGGVITGSATFTWKGMVCGDTANTTGTIDSYNIQYFISDKMLTEAALNSYDWSNAESEIVSGNSCDVEFSQNGGYVYWRIQGVNSIDGREEAFSNWVYGEVFTLGVDKDTTAPEFTDKKVALFDTEVVIPADEDGIDIKEKATCKGKIRWEAATDSGSSVKEYRIEVFTNGAYTLDQVISASDKVTYYDEATKTTYSYLASFDSNGSASFRYRIAAVDFSGNPSGYVYGEWIGDKGAPLFFNENVEVSVTKNTTGSAIIPTLKWNAAVDHSGDQGIRYYEVRVATEFSSNWEYTMLVPAGENSDKYEVTLDNLNLVPGNYVFEVVAVDYFGNRSAGRDNPAEAVVDGSASGSFSTPDTTAPFGVFTSGHGNVFATYRTKYLGSDGKLYDEIPETSEGDQEGSQGDSIEYEEIKTLVDASVTLDWDDNFTDIDHYKVVVSNKPLTADQQEDAITYDFIVDGIQLVFDNETTGRPVGIFQGMKKVYVNIFAYDASGNVASSVCSYDFDFNNYDGTWVDLSKMSGSIATPGRVNVSAGDVIDGVYSDKITLDWSTNSAHTGVYYYAVELKSKDGKTVYKGDTLNKDAAHDTDMKEDNSFYNVRSESVAVGSGEHAATVQRTIVEISDLKKFFNVPDIIDGEYTLTITAYDGKGKAGTPYKHDEPILIDTQRPTQVQVTKYGVNTNEVEGVKTNIVYLNWLPSTDASGIAGYIIEYGETGGTITRKTVDAKVNSYEFSMAYNDNANVDFRVIAVDKKGNVSSAGEWITVQKAPDHYSNDVKAPTVIEFNDNNTASVADIVGKSDVADCFCFTTGSTSETLILNVRELEREFGKNQKIRIDIYEGENTKKVWKSYTVSEISRVFGDLLLKADTKYTFKVTNTDKSSVSRYTMLLERAALQANTADDKFNEGTRDTITETQGERDFVGYGDTIDYRDVELSASGKYTFTLNNVAASTKLTVYEKVKDAKTGQYRLVSLGAVTATASSFAGVTTKELLLDDSKMYVVGISATNTKIYGSEYDLSMNLVESYAAGDENKVVLGDTVDDTVDDTVANGWVGFGDASDDYSFTAGANGSVVNFTINHNGDETGAVKLEIYDTATNKRVGTYTLKAGAAGISTGNLYLAKGSYRVSVIATGAAKAQNSDYALTVNGYDIGADVDIKDNIVTATGLPELSVAGDQLERFVGVGDTVDNFIVTETISAEEVYQFKLSGTNGKEIKAAVGYISKGRFVALTTVTGTAGSDELIISRKFTQADIDKAGTDGFFVQVTANGKNANSQYDLEMVKIDSTLAGFNNADDKILTAKQAEKDTFNYQYGILSAAVSDWVGLGDASDYWKLELSADGMYDLNIAGIENPVKVTLYQVVRNAEDNITSYTTLKSVTVNAANASAVMSNLLLNDAAEYYVGITATGAAKGQNSEYTLTLNQAATQAGTLGSGAADQEISTTGTNWIINAPAAGGAFNFTLDAADIEGGNVKLTVYELLTNGKTRTVKSITVKPGAQGSTGNLYIAADAVSNGTGIYQIEVKGANAKSSGNFDLNVESFDFANADSEQWVGQFGNFTDKDLITDHWEGVYSINLTDIDGNNIKVSILDANGKVVKSFVPAANSTSATFSYAFKDGYQIEFAANGKNKCSEYDWELVERAADTGNDSIDKILNESAVALGEGWVGSNDKTDCFNLGQNAAGYYNLNFEDNLQNDLKVTVYEYDASGSKVKQKSVRSVTLKAGSGNYSLENLLLDGSKNYYVMVQATNTNGTKDTVYNWELSNNEIFTYTTNDDVRETTAASISSNSSVDGWVGYGDAVDCYSFVAGNGAVDFKLMFNGTADGNVTLKIYDSETGKQVGKTLTINSKTTGISTGDLCLVDDREYYLEVKASNAAKGQSASYTLSNTFWEFVEPLADSKIVNKVVLPTDKAPVLDFDFATAVVSGAVWNTADSKNEVDWYKFTVSGKNDSYTLNLSNINGNNVKVSIGYIENGKFKVVQSVTGKAGADELQFSRELGQRDYYVKIETTGINRASEYELNLTCNNDINGFDTNDNTWKQVAANVNAPTYEVGDTIATIENWVGFGDTVDVFKIETDENGRLVFGGDDALQSQEIKLSLMDLNGKSVKLTFDKSTGEYTTGVNLLADTEYFLSVTSSKPKDQNTDYSIAITKL